MKLRLGYVLITLFVIVSPSFAATDDQTSSPRFFATYFYTNVRCPSCLTIERLTSETIREEFAEEIENGILTWRTINIDGTGNFHYVKDYNLYTKSVIISEMDGDREVRWKNLVKVWELLKSEGSFREYLKKEINGFMEPH